MRLTAAFKVVLFARRLDCLYRDGVENHVQPNALEKPECKPCHDE